MTDYLLEVDESIIPKCEPANPKQHTLEFNLAVALLPIPAEQSLPAICERSKYDAPHGWLTFAFAGASQES